MNHCCVKRGSDLIVCGLLIAFRNGREQLDCVQMAFGARDVQCRVAAFRSPDLQNDSASQISSDSNTIRAAHFDGLAGISSTLLRLQAYQRISSMVCQDALNCVVITAVTSLEESAHYVALLFMIN